MTDQTIPCPTCGGPTVPDFVDETKSVHLEPTNCGLPLTVWQRVADRDLAAKAAHDAAEALEAAAPEGVVVGETERVALHEAIANSLASTLEAEREHANRLAEVIDRLLSHPIVSLDSAMAGFSALSAHQDRRAG